MRILAGFVVGLTLILSACGGGTDGSSPPGPPAIAAGSLPGGSTGSWYDYQFAVATGGASPFTWSETGPLPPGLALSVAGQLTGAPVMAGTFNFTVKVTDSSTPALTATLAVSITINAVSIVAGQVPPPGTHGHPYGYSFAAMGGNQPLTWTVTAGALPPGLALDPGYGILAGTPTLPSPTPYAFTVTVKDSTTPTPASDSVAYSITVSEPPAPSINNTPPPTATVGSPYGFTFTVSDGLAPFVWIPPTGPIGGLAFMPDGSLGGTPSAAGIYPITLAVVDALNQSSTSKPFTIRIATPRPAASFTLTGSMAFARDAHTATLLQNGRVLIAGGTDGSTALASAELYDPTTKMFTAAGHMTIGRIGHTATLLADSSFPNHGKVLVVGGTGGQTAELYDPGTGAFTAIGTTVFRHLGQTATLLKDGRVLVAGGETASAELFNPASGSFTATGSLTVSRNGHTATLLPDGRVLIAGGLPDGQTQATPFGLFSAEIYNPASGTFTATGSMSFPLAQHTATLLADGTVLVASDYERAEVFSPATGLFSLVGNTSTGSRATATLRNDGTVLVAGGTFRTSVGTAMLFAPECAGFVFTGPLIAARDGHTATLLADGTVLIAGGTSHLRRCGGYGGRGCSGSDTVLSSAELFK
jgi:WD40 repeat protein